LSRRLDQMSRWMIFLVAASAGSGGADQRPSPGRAPLPQERATIDRYCVGCHSTKAKMGGLALDAIAGDDISRHPEEWEKAIRKLRARMMPPPGLPRPD